MDGRGFLTAYTSDLGMAACDQVRIVSAQYAFLLVVAARVLGWQRSAAFKGFFTSKGQRQRYHLLLGSII